MPKAPGNEASPVPELPFLPQIQKHWRLRRICHGKRTSHLHLCGDALRPHETGRENPKDNAKGLPHQRSQKKRPLMSSTRQRPKAEKEISRHHFTTGGKKWHIEAVI